MIREEKKNYYYAHQLIHRNAIKINELLMTTETNEIIHLQTVLLSAQFLLEKIMLANGYSRQDYDTLVIRLIDESQSIIDELTDSTGSKFDRFTEAMCKHLIIAMHINQYFVELCLKNSREDDK